MNDKPFWLAIGFLLLIGLGTFMCPSRTGGFMEKDPNGFGDLAWGADLNERLELTESELLEVETPYLPYPVEMTEYLRDSGVPEFLGLPVAMDEYYSYKGKFCLVHLYMDDQSQYDALVDMAREKLGDEKLVEEPEASQTYIWFGAETWITMQWNGRREPAIELIARDPLRKLKEKMERKKKIRDKS